MTTPHPAPAVQAEHTPLRRFSKEERDAISRGVAISWLTFCVEKLTEGKSPAKLSQCVRDNILASLEDYPTYETPPPSTITRMCNQALADARDMLDAPRFASVLKHFYTSAK